MNRRVKRLDNRGLNPRAQLKRTLMALELVGPEGSLVVWCDQFPTQVADSLKEHGLALERRTLEDGTIEVTMSRK